MVQRGRGESGLQIVVSRWSLLLPPFLGQTQIHPTWELDECFPMDAGYCMTLMGRWLVCAER
jgi:hypothetical protein